MKNILTAIALLMLLQIGVNAQNRIYSPALRAPANGAVGQMPNALLDWDAVTGQGFVITYELQLAQMADFSDATTFPATTVTAMTMNQLLFDNTYFWRVRASDGTMTSDWSDAFSFRVVPTVTITAPANQSSQNPNPLVRWNPVTGITNYDIQVDTAYSWANQASGTTAQLNDVFEVDHTHAWAVGNGGVILKFLDGAWTTVESGTTQNLNDVFFTDNNNGWAVGAAGTILYYNGTSWTVQTSGVTTVLNGVFFTSPTNGYAVGNTGTALHFNGTAWSAINVGFNLDIYSIHGLDANNIFVAGRSGNWSRFNGTTWTTGIIANRDIMGLWALSPNFIYAAAKAGRIYFYNGTTWTEQTSGSTRDLNDVCFLDENNGYIVGNNGTLLYYNGSIWQTLASGSTQNLNGIYLKDAESGFFVGNAGVIVAYQGEGFNSTYLKTLTVGSDLVEYQFANLAFGKNHYFRMRARHATSTSDWSSARAFSVVASPTLTSPANNATNIALDTLVRWGALTGVVRYTVQLSTDAAFSDPFTYESSTNEYRFQGLSFGQDYFWRVNARHAGGISFWSPVFKFTTINTVTLTSPANNAAQVVRLPRFQWQRIRGAERYLIQYGKSESFEGVENRLVTTDFFQTIFLLDPETNYFWRVRAIQGLDSTNWSQVRSFVTTSETSLSENENASFSIHPNPGNGLITLTAKFQAEGLQIKVYNLIGKLVYENNPAIASGDSVHKLDLRQLGKGVYLMRVSNGKDTMTRKLIIE